MQQAQEAVERSLVSFLGTLLKLHLTSGRVESMQQLVTLGEVPHTLQLVTKACGPLLAVTAPEHTFPAGARNRCGRAPSGWFAVPPPAAPRARALLEFAKKRMGLKAEGGRHALPVHAGWACLWRWSTNA